MLVIIANVHKNPFIKLASGIFLSLIKQADTNTPWIKLMQSKQISWKKHGFLCKKIKIKETRTKIDIFKSIAKPK